MKNVLRHAVGKSTFREGFAVPREFEEMMNSPKRGCSRRILLSFDGQSVPATLRRIGNERGSVQVKYEGKEGEPFRLWLAAVFSATLGGSSGEYFELRPQGADAYEVVPFPANAAPSLSLQVDQWVFHGGADKMFEKHASLAEIPAVVRTVPFAAQEGQSFYNRAFGASFASWNWRSECRVVPDLGLKSDFAKDGVQVEVEFGNARTYYQDFVKFLLGHRYCGIRVGVLVVPSASFARHLCELGRQRAAAKGRALYSGMIDFDKVNRELPYLDFMLSMPIAVAGVGNAAL